MVLHRRARGRERHLGGQVDGVAVDARRDRGEGDACAPVPGRELDRAAVAERQQLRLAAVAAVPDRADGVDDVVDGEPAGAGDPGVAGGAPLEPSAFLQERRAGGAVDGSVDPAAAQQAGVGGVDDGVGLRVRGDVAEVQGDERHGGESGRPGSNRRPQPWEGCALPTELLPRAAQGYRRLISGVGRGTTLGRVRPRLYWPVTLAAAALVGLLAYGLVAKGSDTSIDQAVASGKRIAAPVARLPRLNGTGTGSLGQYRGKPVLLNAWASWCPPCKGEMPLLERAHRRMAAAGGTVLGVDVQDDRASALKFLASEGITFPSLRDRDREYVHSLGVTGYPETFLIDREGRIVALNRGPVSRQWLDANLPKVL